MTTGAILGPLSTRLGTRAPFLAAVVVYIGFTAQMIALPEPSFLAHTAADDAFYYLEIARRAGEARWPTFDGLHTTTGFHPLWLFVLAAAQGVTGLDGLAFARLAVGLSAGLLFAAILGLGRAVARISGQQAGDLLMALLLGSAGVARFGLLGMEAPLSLLFLSLVCLELFAGRGRPQGLLLWLRPEAKQ
jgi:MFS family permease